MKKAASRGYSSIATAQDRREAMDLDEEIMQRIVAAKGWDKNAQLSDFQIRTFENGSVLVNIKTGKAQLLYDDQSVLHDLDDLLWSKAAPPAKSTPLA